MGLETAAIMAIVSATTAVAGAGASFAQANKQKKAKALAEKAADKAMNEAKKKLQVNYMEGTSIAKEAYNIERERMLVANANATSAGQESERGAAATAGRVAAATNDAGQNVQASMEGALVAREQDIATENQTNRNSLVEIDLGEAAGAQQAAADAGAMRAESLSQGMEGVITAGTTMASEFVPLYKQSQEQAFTGASSSTLSGADIAGFNKLGATAYDPRMTDGSMTQEEFNKVKKNMTDEQWSLITSNQGYIDSLN
jgi:hypothetical protein